MDHGSATLSEALSAGNGLAGSENGGSIAASNHGWQKVTNPKKHRRQEARSTKPGQSDIVGSLRNGSAGPENKVFQALEREAEERRAHREALLQAAILGAPGESLQSDSDADGDDDHDAPDISNSDESKKPKVKKPKKPKVTVAEAASAIDPSDLAAFLAQISESFAGSPDIQLIRFADYFGKAFNTVTPTQFGWNKILKEPLAKSVEIPLCYIPESVTKIASDWLVGRPVAALGDFVIWGLNDVASDMLHYQGSHKGSKASPGHTTSKTKVGILAVLALVLRKRPEALLQKASVLRTSPQFQGQEKIVMWAWAYGQAALGDLVTGMQLWVQNLLPIACGKSGTPASRDVCLQFAESLLFANLKKARPILQNGASRKGERLVPPAALDSVMRVSFPSEQSRTKATERFQAIYPVVKEIALFGPHNSKATKAVAQQLLPLCLEAACEDIPTLVNEACATLVWCLLESADCFKQWEKLYLDKLKGSVNGLRYICAEWKTVARQLMQTDILKKTISHFRMENASAKGDAKVVLLLKTSDAQCKVLQKRMARAGPCLKTAATVIAGAGIAYAFYLLNFDIPVVR